MILENIEISKLTQLGCKDIWSIRLELELVSFVELLLQLVKHLLHLKTKLNYF